MQNTNSIKVTKEHHEAPDGLRISRLMWMMSDELAPINNIHH